MRLVASVSLVLALFVAAPAQAATSPLSDAFDKAAQTYDVPRDLLVALGYAETHLDGHGGEPSASGGYGVMHLVSNPSTKNLEKAAELTGLSADQLKTDTAANILGAAAVLGSLAGDIDRKDPAAWYEAVVQYGNVASPEVARIYGDAVYEVLNKGLSTPDVSVAASPVQPQRGKHDRARSFAEILSTDYGPAHWVPASSSNYTVANRPTSNAIDRIVIHVTQGSYAGSISWFQNPSAGVSAHYVIRSSDGDVTQMVRNKDIGWHAGNWTYNQRSIGIEHEGFVNNASWFTDAMYRASAALTKAMCERYGIPKTRSYIIGHNEVPGATHTDPGQYWNWSKYMELVTGSTSTWSTIVDSPTASANWGTSTYSAQKYGANYRFANPEAVSDPAWYRANIPSAGTYRVDVWYPADAGYNDSTPYIVAASGGNQSVRVNQRTGGGSWQSIGTFTLNAGDQNIVGVSRWTSGVGYVIADAVRITKQ
ncbi:N-acetylmuramoyl-L-alanine amidase [Nonomuraea soli]|uniref:N-acetylmuramoyl-L-alanine amidase n=1 Tax=Nonomuraea soli TaxID=1032476 RepID=A0A7W0CMQ9_9ACTN|nr:N-acetylmuramoyl-L-alanine amidase [Nonomuraea soli]MBA2894027.1 N-acetyl-anhydromuramyl-L-alanine amidase AmpD [Nonomuraea soli]